MPGTYKVRLTEDAVADLSEIVEYFAARDAARAAAVLDGVEAVVRDLEQYPERGVVPNELLDLGIRRYREVFFSCYRIIYQVLGEVVHVMIVADGRRDMGRLLQRRLLTG